VGILTQWLFDVVRDIMRRNPGGGRVIQPIHDVHHCVYPISFPRGKKQFGKTPSQGWSGDSAVINEFRAARGVDGDLAPTPSGRAEGMVHAAFRPPLEAPAAQKPFPKL
jgi:hypothetical protein